MSILRLLLRKAKACVREATDVEEASAPLDYVTVNGSRCAGELGLGVGREQRSGAGCGSGEQEGDVDVHRAGVRG